MHLKLYNNNINISTNSNKMDIINIFNYNKKPKSKFVINFFNTLTKIISTTIILTPLIVMDYVIDITREFRIAFTTIFGVSFIKSEQLKKLFGITTIKKWKLNDFDKKTIFETSNYFNSTTVAGFNLLKLINFEKEKFLETRCFKRNRYLLGLPANGQRTHTNGLTARKFKIKI
jgi:ribosomal protein S13